MEDHRSLRMTNIVHLEEAHAKLVILSYLDVGAGPAGLRPLIRRLRRKMPGATILAGCWTVTGGSEETKAMCAEVGADLCATTLREAIDLCVEAARLPAAPVEAAMAAPSLESIVA